MNLIKHIYWVSANIYGIIFGWPWLTQFHRIMVLYSLHALGYDNSLHRDWSGEKRFIKNVLKKYDIQVCIDIGANVGNYTAILNTSFSRATIYAIEPLSSAHRILTERFRSNSNITTFHGALSNFQGESYVYTKSKTAETASLDSEVLTASFTKEKTYVTTLDLFVQESGINRIDFIKIDTEGFEREVLMGAKEVIYKLKPQIIQFEFNVLHLRRKYTLLEITTLLPNYTFYRLLPHGHIKINPSSFLDNVFMFSNIIAIRKD